MKVILPKTSKWKQKSLWVTLTSLILMVLANLGVYETIGITQEEVQNIVNVILGLLSGWGIIKSHDDTNTNLEI